MPTTAGPELPSDRVPVGMAAPMPTPVPEAFARDAIIAWFRGEFAAANAIIDALCNHLTQLDGLRGCGSDYESVFAAIHRRRLNWIPLLHMQKYYSIAGVAMELQRVAGEKMKTRQEEETQRSAGVKAFLEEEEEEESTEDKDEIEREPSVEEFKESEGSGDNDVVEEEHISNDDSSDRKDAIQTGFEEGQLLEENRQIFSNHEALETRCARIKMTKGFVAKEAVKGRMANVVKGLKLHEDVFTESELSKLTSFVNELRVAGQNGELSGDTFILFNKQIKGNKRELIQLGVPIFGQIKEESANKSLKRNIDPIPPVLQNVIDHLLQWHLIPESKKPNSCIINFFDEGEYSQPYTKPPHLDQPISTLLLSESTMAFGRVLVSDHHGNFKGPLVLSLKQGSLLVMRGRSADMARHVICQSSNRRVSITFFRVRTDTNQIHLSTIPPFTKAMTLWQPGMPNPSRLPNGAFKEYGAIDVVPRWGVVPAPLVMLSPLLPMVVNTRRIPRGGTGVFLPWTEGPKKHVKHLPPRAQRGRFLALPAPLEAEVIDPNSNSGG